ncbi:hypothetical protein Tco_0866732, partial [Tanacetum coccineum]
MPITTAKEKAQRRLEVKARSTLMIGIPNEHQLKFNSIKDAKKLLEAMIDQTFDRLQKLVIQLELLDEKISQEDVNKKLLRSLPPEWNTHAIVWRNKADLERMSIDDLYNNLKCMNQKLKGCLAQSMDDEEVPLVDGVFEGALGALAMHAYYAKELPIPPPTIVPLSSMLSPMFNPQEFFLLQELLPLKKRGRDRSSSSTSALPREFKIGESSSKTSLERHEEQIEEILNHLMNSLSTALST